MPDFPQPSLVLGPDDGESLWQPMPSRGHIRIILTPDNSPYDEFSCGTQVLPPGGEVREHGHRRNHELLHVYRGTGHVVIDDVRHALTPGSTVLFGRHAYHFLVNDGDGDLEYFWVFFPPGLEDWFRAIGRPRRDGEPMPPAFDRPDGVAEVMAGMRFQPARDG